MNIFETSTPQMLLPVRMPDVVMSMVMTVVVIVVMSSALVFNAEAKTSYSKFPAVKKKGEFVDAVSNNPVTLNPILYASVDDANIIGWIYLPLFGRDEQTYDQYPILAKSVVVSKDKKNYHFTLNDQARWADGSSVTSDDVGYTFAQIQNPKVKAAVLRSYFHGIEFKKINDLEFEFFVESPRFNTLERLSGFVPIQKKQFEGEDDFNRSRANLHPVGTGAYQVESISRDSKIVLKRVKNWWGEKLPAFKARFNFDQIVFRVLADPALRYESFLDQKVDFINLTSDQFVNQVQKVDRAKVGSSPKSGKAVWAKKFTSERPTTFFGLAFNLKHPIFSSQKTRLALAYLTDYDAITERAFLGTADHAVSPFGSKTAYTAPELRQKKNQHHLNPKKAMELLKADGWADTDGDNLLDKKINGRQTPFRFEHKYPAGSAAQDRTAQMMKEQFKKSGIEMNLRPLDWTALGKDIHEHQFDTLFMAFAFGSLHPDPRQIWHSSSSEGGSNGGSYSNPQVDQLIEKANLEFNRKKREKLLQEISRILYKDVPYIFILERSAFYNGLNSKLKSPKWTFRYSTEIAKDFFYE